MNNLVKTSNHIDFLSDLYRTAVDRFAGGGFDLRSCNSNNANLRDLMQQDGKLVGHDCEFDKVLGYLYSPVSDVIKLNEAEIDETVNSKRGVLSQTAKVFDPLGLAAPVTVRGKTLISGLWEKRNSKDHWDEVVSGDDQTVWRTLSADLSALSSLEFS